MSIRPIISLTKKQTLRRQLSNCHLIAGIYCNGLSTTHLQNLRASLPKSSKLIITRNSLIYQTLKNTKFEPLTQCATGMNGWLFVNDDEDLIPKVMKIYRDFVKKEGLGFNDFRGAMFEGRVYGPEEIVELEHMPTRTERCAYLVGCLQMPAAWLTGILEDIDRVKNEVENGAAASAPAA